MNVFQESLQESLAHFGPFPDWTEARTFLLMVFLGSAMGTGVGVCASVLFDTGTEPLTQDALVKRGVLFAKIGALCGAAVGGAIFLLVKPL